jgi:cytochrome c peroxidase
MMSDFEFHVLGVAEDPRLPNPDEGAEKFAFRTPTLRNLSFTAPYMHNGSQATLEDVMRFYQAGRSRNPHVPAEALDPDFGPIFDIEADNIAAIVAFLRTFDDEHFDREVPARVPSGLSPGGRLR